MIRSVHLLSTQRNPLHRSLLTTFSLGTSSNNVIMPKREPLLKTNNTFHETKRDQPWYKANIIHVSKETPTITNVLLKIIPNKENPNFLFSFVPGQWIDLVIHIGGKKYVGGYSPYSSPSSLPLLQLGIRFNSKHPVSNYFHHLQLPFNTSQNPQVDIRGGSGTCVYTPKKNDNVTFVAGGIGITPIFSMIQSALEYGASGEDSQNTIPFQLRLFYSVRNLDELAFYELLIDLKKKYSNHFQLFVSSTCRDNDCENDRKDIKQSFIRYGRWNVQDFLPVSTHDNHLFYLCGPPSMVDKFRYELISKENFSNDQIRYEKWW